MSAGLTTGTEKQLTKKLITHVPSKPLKKRGLVKVALLRLYDSKFSLYFYLRAIWRLDIILTSIIITDCQDVISTVIIAFILS